MTLIVESVKKYGQLDDPLDGTQQLADNHGDIVTVEVNIRYEVYRVAQSVDADADPENKPVIVFAPLPEHTGLVVDDSAIWISDRGTSWDDFNVGDSIFTTGGLVFFGINNGGATILEILDDKKGTRTLITDRSYRLEALQVGGVVGNTTPQTSMLYSHGLIENKEIDNFISKVDGSTQIAILDGISYLNPVFKNAILKGNRSWILSEDSIQIKGNGIGLGNTSTSIPPGSIQAFTIKHEVPISPFILAGQFIDAQNEIPPAWFLNNNALKYVFKIDTNTAFTDPNNQTTVLSDSTLDGNTGWFDESFNGNETKYSVVDLEYKKADATINPALQLTSQETRVSFAIVSTAIPAPFSSGDTKIDFMFYYAPQDRALYRDIKVSTSETMEHNFMYDNVISTASGASDNPRSFGTSELKIKSIVTTYVSDSRIEVAVVMQFSDNLVTRIAAQPKQRYVIGVGVKNHALTRDVSDKVKLMIDTNDFFIDQSDPDMILQDLKYMTHPFSNIATETKEFIDARVEDDVLCIDEFLLDRNGRETDDVILTGITSQIVAVKTTGATFILDEHFISLTGTERIDVPVYGKISNPNINAPRGFKTPADENRANVKLFRRYADDVGGFFAFTSQFPTAMRWEYFIELGSVSDDFFDPNEPNQGKNQQWTRYAATADWDIKYRTIITATKNGNPLRYSIEKVIGLDDYDEGLQWENETITTFDEDDVALISGGDIFVIKYADGRVQADFGYIGPAPNPSLADLVGVLIIDIFEQGTFKSTYTLSSAYDKHPNAWMRAIGDTNRVVLTNPVGNTFRLEALIIGSQLPDSPVFKISARIYDKRGDIPCCPNAKQMEDGTFKTMEGSNDFKFKE